MCEEETEKAERKIGLMEVWSKLPPEEAGALQSVMPSEWESQLNSALFCMIAHDNCVLIGSAGDGV